MNSKYPSRSADKFVVRLPDGLRADVQEAADERDTSMNTVVVQAIRRDLDAQNRQGLLLDALAAAVEKNSAFIAVRDDQVRTLEQRRHAEQQACQAAELRIFGLIGLLKEAHEWVDHNNLGGPYVCGLRDRLAAAIKAEAAAIPPEQCRQRLAADGKPYPRSSCSVCGQFSPRAKECDATINAGGGQKQ